MSTPTVAGTAALMRQYFTDGYYPSGSKTAADARKPLGSELKATLMNGTAFITGTPGNTMGWGRIWLDNNLFFAGEAADTEGESGTVAGALQSGMHAARQVLGE